MEKIHKLQGINYFLSLFVILLSITILEYLYSTSPISTNKPSFYTETIPELYVAEETSPSGRVVSWLETKRIKAEEYEISLWLEAQQPIKLVDLTVAFDPVNLLVVDAQPDLLGIQANFGEADIYLENEVDNEKGIVTLAGRFEKQQSGKLLLGKLHVRKLLSKKTEVQIRFTPNSFQDSYAKGSENEENILVVKPGITL
ncbi:MAG: hypothetical protein ACOX6V_02630 [Patescibacteria group bacterium]|jgi:hypothetical protein